MDPHNKKSTKQLAGKRDDTALHSAVRLGNLEAARAIILCCEGAAGPRELLSKQNQVGETPLYVAAEYGHVELVREMIKDYDLADAGIKARNGFDAFHIAAKQGNLGMYQWTWNSRYFCHTVFRCSGDRRLQFHLLLKKSIAARQIAFSMNLAH